LYRYKKRRFDSWAIFATFFGRIVLVRMMRAPIKMVTTTHPAAAAAARPYARYAAEQMTGLILVLSLDVALRGTLKY
jgi:hypothetical protein